jgi:hypothetical protein
MGAQNAGGREERSMTVEEREEAIFREVLNPVKFLIEHKVGAADASYSYTAGVAIVLLLTDVMSILSGGDIRWFLENFLEKVPDGHRYREHRDRLTTLRHVLHHELSLAEAEVVLCTSPPVHLLPTELGTAVALQNLHTDMEAAVRMYFASARMNPAMRERVEKRMPFPRVQGQWFPSDFEPGTTTP